VDWGSRELKAGIVHRLAAVDQDALLVNRVAQVVPGGRPQTRQMLTPI